MAGQPRRVYAPSMEPAGKAPPPPKRTNWPVVIFSVLVALGSLVFLWSALFGAGTTPVVKAPTAPFKVAVVCTTDDPIDERRHFGLCLRHHPTATH